MEEPRRGPGELSQVGINGEAGGASVNMQAAGEIRGREEGNSS